MLSVHDFNYWSPLRINSSFSDFTKNNFYGNFKKRKIITLQKILCVLKQGVQEGFMIWEICLIKSYRFVIMLLHQINVVSDILYLRKIKKDF